MNHTANRLLVDVAALSDRGRMRDRNEDAYAVIRMGRFLERVTSSLDADELPERHEAIGYLMMVADGLGGHEAGEVASRTAITRLVEGLIHEPRWALKVDDPETRSRELGELEERSRKYLARMQAAVRERAAEDPSMAGMGTTFTGVYTVGRDLFVMHVGDSKAYLIRRGELQKITRDHTLAQEYADLGMIPQEEVDTHRLHHVLTRAVGAHEETPAGDFHHLQIEDGDRVLVCSDGLTDMASAEEILAILHRYGKSELASKALIDLALERGGRDNVTVILAGFSFP